MLVRLPSLLPSAPASKMQYPAASNMFPDVLCVYQVFSPLLIDSAGRFPQKAPLLKRFDSIEMSYLPKINPWDPNPIDDPLVKIQLGRLRHS